MIENWHNRIVKEQAMVAGPRRFRPLRMAVSRIANDVWDLRNGFDFGKIKHSPYATLGCNATMSTDVLVLPAIFDDAMETKRMVDVGCGRGRVIRWLLNHGYKGKIVGVEIDPEIGRIAQELFSEEDNVDILVGDILQMLRPEWDRYYCYNPFSVHMLRRFLNAIVPLRMNNGACVAYYNPRILTLDNGDQLFPHDYIPKPWTVKYKLTKAIPVVNVIAYFVLKPTP